MVVQKSINLLKINKFIGHSSVIFPLSIYLHVLFSVIPPFFPAIPSFPFLPFLSERRVCEEFFCSNVGDPSLTLRVTEKNVILFSQSFRTEQSGMRNLSPFPRRRLFGTFVPQSDRKNCHSELSLCPSAPFSLSFNDCLYLSFRGAFLLSFRGCVSS